MDGWYAHTLICRAHIFVQQGVHTRKQKHAVQILEARANLPIDVGSDTFHMHTCMHTCMHKAHTCTWMDGLGYEGDEHGDGEGGDIGQEFVVV